MESIRKILLIQFFPLLLVGCIMEIPDVPKADLTISSISPVELTSVNQNDTLSVTYSWQIYNYDTSKGYAMQVLLYDTNTNSPYVATSFDLFGASGTSTNSYSSQTFYNCFLGCVRKTALPFRLYFTIERSDNKTLARSREYVYN